ncbi:hypothetical protein ACFLXK_04395 [Chloroflexota bacterium]
MEDRRAQLRKLATLENPKANEYLVSFAHDLIKEVKQSEDNDYVAQQLDLLNEFAFRVPEQALEVIRFIISSKPAESKVIKGSLGEFQGRTHRDLLLGAIELLDYLRYIVPDDVLFLAAQLSLHQEKEVHDKALNVVREYSKYDLRVLPKIGYSAQRKMADFILSWSTKEKIIHLEFIEVAAKELLSSSVGSSEMTSVDTVTITYGQVTPTEFLKKIRLDVLNLIYELFKMTSDPKEKLKLVEVLDQVTQPPHNEKVAAELMEMLRQDSEYLIEIYRKITSEGNPAVINHIEHRLQWMNRSDIFKSDKTEQLRNEILSDDFYRIFRLLVGDRADYQDEGGWKEAERKRREQMRALIDSIDETNLEEWSDKLNKIAEQHGLIDTWRFYNFEYFIVELTQMKSQLAHLLVDKAFTKKLPLAYFLGSFLLGLRMINMYELWDTYTEKVIESQDSEHTKRLVYSLSLPKEMDLEKAVRDKDLNLLETIVNQDAPFDFLTGINNPLLHHTLFETILRNHKRATGKIESLIVREMERNPQYLESFLSYFPLAIARDWISIKEFQPDIVKFIADRLVEIPDLNWEMQELLLDIGQCGGGGLVMAVFMKRIHMDEELRKEKTALHERYDAIPYQLNPRLQEFISKGSEYEQVMTQWISDMTPEWSIYNWHVSHFLRSIGYGFSKMLMSIIQKGDDNSLKKAARALHSMEGTDLNLSIEIVRRTDSKDILRLISTNMYATGVVSGEYGIAISYENKAKELEKYKDDSSERVRKFVIRMIQSLNEDAIKERQRADEAKQIRRIEFEG